MIGNPQSFGQAAHEPIQLAPWTSAWPAQYQRERDRLLSALPGRLVSIEHIGSTAVQGLAAKPVIDMVGGVTSMAVADALLDDLCALGYTTSVEYNAMLTDRRWLMRHANGRRTHHLHLVVFGSDAWRSRIAFRDALRADAALRQRYLELKQQLAAQHPTDREAYSRAKLPFIADALRQAGLALAEPPPVRRPASSAARAPELLRAAQAAEQAAYAAGSHLLASRSRLAALVFTREQPDIVASQIRHETEAMIRDVLRKRFPSHG